ncbi:MAG: N-acetylmuramoyl-L-alanine amidase, partial [Eubacterium sp.]|nr:N-acetylmuramoyl-L-alanine amidase [Eubacterium sp.]
MRKRKKIILTILLFTAAFFCGRKGAEITYAVQENKPAERIVWIDPGHGGADPGKVGVGDVLEKDINLQIAMK